MKRTAKKKNYLYTLGRRKRSTARIRLYEGKGEIQVNNLAIKDYFRGIPEACYLKPFELTGTAGRYYVTAKIVGGGKFGQVGAFVHGVSRALVKADQEKFKKVLKKAGFLKRDPREKERRKPGFAQKARAKKQSPKR